MDKLTALGVVVFIFCVLYTAWCLYAALTYAGWTWFYLVFATVGIWNGWRIGRGLVDDWHHR